MSNADENTWAQLETSAPSSSGPTKRRSHSACVHKDKMFVFGGSNGEQTFSDLWQFDFGELLVCFLGFFSLFFFFSRCIFLRSTFFVIIAHVRYCVCVCVCVVHVQGRLSGL